METGREFRFDGSVSESWTLIVGGGPGGGAVPKTQNGEEQIHPIFPNNSE